MKIVFFGTPLFAAKVLSFLLEQQIAISAVITKPDKPKGRSGTPQPTAVKQVAQAHNIPFYQPELVSDPSFAETLSSLHADLFVVVAYGEILKQHLLDMPRLGCINLHASLLPKYRGAAPIQRAIMEGEKVMGVSIMHMVKKMDAGDVIKTVETKVLPEEQFPEIEDRLCTIGSQALLQVIHAFEKGVPPQVPQDHTQATYAPKIELEECELLWSLPAQRLHNLVRAVTPQPGAWCWVKIRGEKKRLRILKTAVKNLSGSPGALLSYGQQGLHIACGEQALSIIELQLEGKKRMSAIDFMRGLSQNDITFKF